VLQFNLAAGNSTPDSRLLTPLFPPQGDEVEKMDIRQNSWVELKAV